MLRISAIFALLAAASLSGVKLLLAEHLWWPFAIVEHLAAAALAVGAFLALKRRSGLLLTAAWGFTAGITWSTLFHHLQERPQPGILETGLSILLAVSVAGIALALAGRIEPRQQRTQPPTGILVVGLGVLVAATSWVPAKASTSAPAIAGCWLVHNPSRGLCAGGVL